MSTTDVIDPRGLLGEWALTRSIEDRRTGESSRVEGTTALTLEPDGRIRWYESGVLHRKDGKLPVSRTLFIEPRDGDWFVTFEDGRDFHPWRTGSEVGHDCSPDWYAGRIEALDRGRWSVEWRVNGPSKDYTMRSVLTRSGR